jgi:hypothetical protein
MTDSVERGRRGAGIHRGAPTASPTAGPVAAQRPGQQGQSDDTVVGLLGQDGGGPTGQPGGPPDDDGLLRELAAVGRRRYWNKLTIYLGAVVLLVCGIVIGAQVQKSYGTPTPVAGPAAGARGGQAPGGGGFAGAPGGAQGGAGQPGGANAAGSTAGKATTGTVKLVDGTTVYLETADGSVLTVKTGNDTAVKMAKDGSLKDLKAGDKVTVEGTDSAGTVTATSVIGQPK